MNNFPSIIKQPVFNSICAFTERTPYTETGIHKNDGTKIIFIQEGQTAFLINGQKLTVERGDLLIIHPFTEHHLRPLSEEPFKAYVLSFLHLELSELPKGFLTSPDQPCLYKAQENYMTIEKYLENIEEEIKIGAFGSEELVSSILVTLLIKILRFIHSDTNSDRKASMSEKIVKYIKENYNRDLSLDELASIVFVNPYHLAHTFKSEIGVPPIQFLIQYRIEKAKEILIHTNMPVREIAFKVGYPNANYFNSLFKKFTGLSPGKFRKTTR